MELLTVIYVGDMSYSPMKLPIEWCWWFFFVWRAFSAYKSINDYITDEMTDIIEITADKFSNNQ
jgi:hypothetical protein